MHYTVQYRVYESFLWTLKTLHLSYIADTFSTFVSSQTLASVLLVTDATASVILHSISGMFVFGNDGFFSHRGHRVTGRGHRWPEKGSSYSPGAVDADYSLSPPKTICAWWRATSYEWWPCCAEHIRSKGVNLEKQSPILWCECHA